MEKDLKLILSEMRRLMDYDRKSGLINEIVDMGLNVGKSGVQVPDYPTDELGNKLKNTEALGYRQEMIGGFKGFFDNDMHLGECFDVTYFDANSNAENCMDIPNIKRDSLGYYFEEDNLQNPKLKVKIYLPKTNWFQQFNGLVKSFIAHKTCYDKKNNPSEGKKFSLTYQLLDPRKAVVQTIVTRDGTTSNDSDDRGWSAAFFGKEGSGYFHKGTTDKTLTTSPTEYEEYRLVGYAEEYSRSEFDIWYDSGWGTFFQFVIPLLLSVMTGGLAGALSLSYRAALAVEFAVELGFGLVEGAYLYDRGQYTGAALALIFAFVPLLNETKFLKNAVGAPQNYDEFLQGVVKQGEEGFFKTPGDVKAWIKGLPDARRKWVELVMEKGTQEIQQKGAKEVEERIQKAIYDVLEDVRVSQGVRKPVISSTAFEGLREPLESVLKRVVVPTVKLLGINFGIMIAIYPLIAKLFPDDEEFQKDPQKLIDKFTEKAEFIQKKVKELQFDTLQGDLAKKVDEIMMRVKDNPNPDTKDLTEIYYLMKETALSSSFTEETINDLKSRILREFFVEVYNEVSLKIQESIRNNDQKNTKDLIKVNEGFIDGLGIYVKYLTNCPTFEVLPFQTRDEVCDFGSWLLTTYPNSKWTDTKNNLVQTQTCDWLDTDVGFNLSADTLANYCGYRQAYVKTKEIYDKVKTNKTTETQTKTTTSTGELPPLEGGLPPLPK